MAMQEKTSKTKPSFKAKLWNAWHSLFCSTATPIVFDLIFAAVLLIISILNINIDAKETLNNWNSAIVSLLPAVITVISVSLQIGRETIFDVPIKDFQVIRQGPYFGLVHMAIITVCVFACELVAQFIQKPAFSLALSCVALFYSFWFAITELPLLMKNEKSALKIVSRYVISYREQEETHQRPQDKNEIFNKILRAIILKRGIKETYASLSGKKTEHNYLLRLLLSQQSQALEELLEKVNFHHAHPFLPYKGQDVLESLQRARSSLADLLNFYDSFNYLIYWQTSEDIYPLVWLTRLSHWISIITKTEDKEARSLKSALIYYFLRKDKNRATDFIYAKYVCAMVLGNAQTGETWFLRAFRDYDYRFSSFALEKHSLVYFSSMVLCFAYNSHHIPMEHKKQINAFMDEPSQGLNSDTSSLREVLSASIKNQFNLTELLNAINSFLDITSVIGKGFCTIYPQTHKTFIYDDSVELTQELIVKYWIDILLFHPSLLVFDDALSDFRKGLSENRLETIGRVVERRYRSINREWVGGETPYLDFLFGSQTPKCVNEEIKTFFNDIAEECARRKYNEKHEPISDEFLSEITKNQKEKAEEIINGYNLETFNPTAGSKKFSRPFRLEGEPKELKELHGLYMGMARGFVDSCLKKLFINQIQRKDAIPSYSNKIINEVIDFSPAYYGDNWCFIYACDKDQRTTFYELNAIKISFLPKGLFSKKDGFSIYIRYCEEESVIRRATMQEINKIIDDEYTLANGLYTFSPHGGSWDGSFLVTRDELAGILKDRILFGTICFDIAVSIDDSKVLMFELNETEPNN